MTGLAKSRRFHKISPVAMVIPSIATDRKLLDLKRRLGEMHGVVHVSGLWGSSAPMIAATAAEATRGVILYVVSHLEEADRAQDDLEFFLQRPCDLFPAWETLPGEGAAAGEVEAERLNICGRFLGDVRSPTDERACVIVTPIQALLQPVPPPKALRANTLRLEVGKSVAALEGDPTEALVQWAVDRGFERLEMIEEPGDIARRGDIIDIFIPGELHPHRLQFFDDQVEAIRRFDISTQRSHEHLEALAISAMPSGGAGGARLGEDLFAYLPEDTLVILDGPSEIQEMGETFLRRLGHPPTLYDVPAILESASRGPQVHLGRFGAGRAGGDDHFHFDVASLSRFEGKASDAVSSLCEVAGDHTVHVICDNEGEKQRLAEMIVEHAPNKADCIELAIGVLHTGFEWRPTRTIVVAHHEIFHRHRQRRRLRRIHAGRPLDSWMDLRPGDVVVHLTHGIGIYRGLERIAKAGEGKPQEFLSVEYADKAIVHVPISQVDLVQRYIGAGGIKPRLSKLGGKRWGKTKDQVASAVNDLAAQLLELQAARHEGSGTAYPPDTEWQREFEASFLYEETEDQLVVAGEIRRDLTRPRPMDRLVCGDVGYGKTELAMRAAFKVVEYGRQVAVLVPTTVLAEQHYETFRERMADYPFAVGCLSRFRKATDQKKLLEMARKGQIDIVIGTHRLLSKDVGFADLGLIIIDEEQRFGVEHKERLKAMRATVDVLTLTATPIPRTLHMSLVGIRDISSLQTPPVDRRSIATQVRAFEARLIRDAIIRELNRDGQVFFVHNFVRSIQSMADQVRKIVPEARVIYGHGQMKDGELEEVMHRFVRREADVLVATTIIESGIDIPTANTILIDRADRFGLADLHQLRGRVGRSRHKAYCYLLISPERTLDPKAVKRLKAIEEFSDLGAGFQIAMRDLEIRGAGNLLGREQSGHIAQVGYELYCQLLDRAVRRLKNEPEPADKTAQLDLDVSAHIPAHYIASDRSRIEVYRRMAACRTREDLIQLERDLEDAFGAHPPEVTKMLELAEIRVLALQMGIRSIRRQPPDVIFSIENMAAAEPVFTDAPGSVRMPDAKTIHLRLPPNYLEPTTLPAVLRRMFNRALEQSE